MSSFPAALPQETIGIAEFPLKPMYGHAGSFRRRESLCSRSLLWRRDEGPEWGTPSIDSEFPYRIFDIRFSKPDFPFNWNFVILYII